MSDPTRRTRALRECAIVDSGLDAAFDRLARLAATVTRARSCVIGFGEDSNFLVKGFWGPSEAPIDEVLPPHDMLEGLLDESGPKTLWKGHAAGAVVQDPTGTKVGVVFARGLAPRTGILDSLDALSDIAQLARNELAIRRVQRPDERTAKILESMTDACVFLDRDWRYTYVNKRAGEIFNRNPQDLVGKHIWTEFPDGVGQSFYRAYYKAVEEQMPAQLEEYYPPLNRWFENRIYPSPDGLAIFFQDVTERRRAEEERRRLATIIETTTDLVAVSNAEGGLLFLNRAGHLLLGIPHDVDLRNLHIVRLHALASRDLLCDALPLAVKTGAWNGEATLLHANGAKISASEVLLWHPAQAPEGGYFSLVARDITERKRAEEQKRKDQEVRTQAERMAHLGFWIWDVHSNRFTWSDELYRIYSVDEQSFVPSFQGYLQCVHPQDRARVRETMQTSLRDRTSCAFEMRIVRPDGQVRHLHSWANVALNDAGQVAQMFGTCLDFTDLVMATKGLQHTEEWLGAALRNTRVAVWEWNLRTNDLKISEGAAEALGLRPEELARSFDSYIEHVYPEDLNAVMQALRVSVDEGHDVELEHRILASDRTPKWLVIRSHPCRGVDGRVDRLIGTVVDVTDRHRNEEERRQLLERLKHAQKMEAIGRLAAGVAHDFNNHLTIVQSAVELLLRNPALQPSLHEAILGIQDAARNASTLTKQLLALSRHQKRTLKIAPLDLNDVIQSTCKLVRHLLPENITLSLSLAPSLEAVRTDREQLERVLLNLIVNARDAMPEGGRLSISTRVEDAHAIFEICDTGLGMTPEIQERIFEPFFTTKTDEQRMGTGLGLATVYGIVTQSGGAIEVKSDPEAGTCFVIRLPFVESAKSSE